MSNQFLIASSSVSTSASVLTSLFSNKNFSWSPDSPSSQYTISNKYYTTNVEFQHIDISTPSPSSSPKAILAVLESPSDIPHLEALFSIKPRPEALFLINKVAEIPSNFQQFLSSMFVEIITPSPSFSEEDIQVFSDTIESVDWDGELEEEPGNELLDEELNNLIFQIAEFRGKSLSDDDRRAVGSELMLKLSSALDKFGLDD
ncbi:hypothetical protein RCL1_007510 [Eukaryota sp. TZLM3-RCL]